MIKAHEYWIALPNDTSFSNEAGGFGYRLRKYPTYEKIVALRRIISLRPAAEAKNLNT